jgi:peptidoglycan biosynthesis protein MviN/MurJ (putative lipid II flippase)
VGWGATLVVVAAAVGVASLLYVLQKRFGRARQFGWAAFAVWLSSLCAIMFFELVEADTFPFIVLGSAVVVTIGLCGLVRADNLKVVEEVMSREDS